MRVLHIRTIAFLTLFTFSSSSICLATDFKIKCLDAEGKFSDCKVKIEDQKIILNYNLKKNQVLNEEILGENVKSISAGEYSRRRVAEGVGTAVLTLGIGALLMFSKKKRDHIGVEYTDAEGKHKATAFEVSKKYGLPFKMGLRTVSGKDVIEEQAAPK